MAVIGSSASGERTRTACGCRSSTAWESSVSWHGHACACLSRICSAVRRRPVLTLKNFKHTLQGRAADALLSSLACCRCRSYSLRIRATLRQTSALDNTSHIAMFRVMKHPTSRNSRAGGKAPSARPQTSARRSCSRPGCALRDAPAGAGVGPGGRSASCFSQPLFLIDREDGPKVARTQVVRDDRAVWSSVSCGQQ